MNRVARGLMTSAVTILVAGIGLFPWAKAAAAGDGVALAIVYDTSGSMLQPVRDREGHLTPKTVIAERALRAVVNRVEVLRMKPETARLPIQAGLVVFEGEEARFAVKFGPFKAEAFRSWLDHEDKPKAGTPLGKAVELAGQAVLASDLPRKHVLVITDGINTKGPDPTVTIPRVQQRMDRVGAKVTFHFVAFDVDAQVFSGVKKLGATVVGAADEGQLNSQLEFIVQKKILLEDEELPSKSKTE